jgi:hypothetical protein
MEIYIACNLIAIIFIGIMFLSNILAKNKAEVEKLYPIIFDKKDWIFIFFLSLIMVIFSILMCFKNLIYLIAVILWLNLYIGLIFFHKHYTALEERNKDKYTNHMIQINQAEKPKYFLIFFWIFYVGKICYEINYVK